MKKKHIAVISVILAVFLTGIIAGSLTFALAGKGISHGRALITDNGSLMLISNNSPIKLSDVRNKGSLSEGIESGDKILVIHDGINESYPASTGAYLVFKTSDGSIEDIPAEVISALKNLGWLSSDKNEEAPASEESLDFRAAHIKTGCPQSEAESPSVSVISTVAEKELYIKQNGEKLSLGDEFREKTSCYDGDFFLTESLVCIFLSEGSSSISHRICKVTKNNDTVNIYIEKDIPETGTCDMAYHHILIELEKEAFGESQIRLIIDDGQENIVEKKGAKGGFSVTVPKGFGFSEGEMSVDIFSLSNPQVSLTVEFTDSFGVCGTGLRTEEYTLSEKKASMGIYDMNPSWDYIVLRENEHYLVVYNHTKGGFGEKEKQDIDSILESITAEFT